MSRGASIFQLQSSQHACVLLPLPGMGTHPDLLLCSWPEVRHLFCPPLDRVLLGEASQRRQGPALLPYLHPEAPRMASLPPCTSSTASSCSCPCCLLSCYRQPSGRPYEACNGACQVPGPPDRADPVTPPTAEGSEGRPPACYSGFLHITSPPAAAVLPDTSSRSPLWGAACLGEPPLLPLPSPPPALLRMMLHRI